MSDKQPYPAYDEWRERERDRIGTHYDGCFQYHPACAVLAEQQRIVGIIEELEDHDGHVYKPSVLAAIKERPDHA